MLGEEKVFTVQFSEGFEDGYLGYLLGRKPNRLAGLPQRHILRWAPGKSAFSERIGFDLHVVVPWELKNNAD